MFFKQKFDKMTAEGSFITDKIKNNRTNTIVAKRKNDYIVGFDYDKNTGYANRTVFGFKSRKKALNYIKFGIDDR